MLKGKVSRALSNKGFGFIKVNDDEYFFHKDDFHGFWDDLCNDHDSNQEIQVTFEPDTTPKGLRARNVSRTDYPNQAA